MRLVSFTAGAGPRFGAVSGAAIRDMTGWCGHPSLRSVLAANALSLLQAAIPHARDTHALGGVMLLPPVPNPDKCICVGVNYPGRDQEVGGDQAPYPSLFLRVPGSFVGHGQPILRPKASTQFDYEGEIVLVIGRAGRHIPRASALSHVAGLTLCNDGSVRDWMRHGRFNVTQGKNFDRSGSIGPWMVPASELDLSRPIGLRTRVNGELRQHDSTARLIFPFDELIAYVSTFTTLLPGDLIATGTPAGAIAGARARDIPPRWLVPGDVVEVEADGIGILSNTVQDEAQ